MSGCHRPNGMGERWFLTFRNADAKKVERQKITAQQAKDGVAESTRTNLVSLHP
jgi:hypothetical protein